VTAEDFDRWAEKNWHAIVSAAKRLPENLDDGATDLYIFCRAHVRYFDPRACKESTWVFLLALWLRKDVWKKTHALKRNRGVPEICFCDVRPEELNKARVVER
jgi:hypothetical protein